MSKLIFTFKTKWIEEKKLTYKNPIRKMEGFIRDYEGVKLIKSSYESLTVEVNEEDREKFSIAVGKWVRENFAEPQPWEQMKISGDTKGMNMPSGDNNSETEKKVVEGSVEADANERKEEQSAEVKKEKDTSEIELIKESEVKSFEETICEGVPLKYSPELSDYIRELGAVISMLDKMYSTDCLWSQSLLVAIDSGYGYTSFLNSVGRVYCNYEKADITNWDEGIKEIVIENHSDRDKKYSGWKEVLARAKEMAKANQKAVKRVILSLDISQWQNELYSSEVVWYLRQISEVATNFICAFKIPFMEGQVVRNIQDALSDVMDIKVLVVPPISIDNMVDYLKRELISLNCMITEESDNALEQWIFQEKNDDSFYGYKTLNKMVKQLIYKKAQLNCLSGTAQKIIQPEDIMTLLHEPEVEEEPYKLLGDLIGIAEVKQKIGEIVVQIKTQKEMLKEGADIERPCIHMVFTGKPGTGKTTVARILAKILKEENVLRKGHFYEIQGRNLCGRYVGETAPKTSTYCRDAYGSILFIDEAYSLYQGYGDRDYGKEAIQTLIAEMENHRDDFCVIMAGYKEEMEQLMEANPGLESRIPYIIDFPNYSREELVQIFFKMLEGKFAYNENLYESVNLFFDSIPDEVMDDKKFSNARLVRNLFERAWGKAAYRRSLSGEKQLEIRKEDLMCASEEGEFKKLLESKGRSRIGF